MAFWISLSLEGHPLVDLQDVHTGAFMIGRKLGDVHVRSVESIFSTRFWRIPDFSNPFQLLRSAPKAIQQARARIHAKLARASRISAEVVARDRFNVETWLPLNKVNKKQPVCGSQKSFHPTKGFPKSSVMWV